MGAEIAARGKGVCEVGKRNCAALYAVVRVSATHQKAVHAGDYAAGAHRSCPQEATLRPSKIRAYQGRNTGLQGVAGERLKRVPPRVRVRSVAAQRTSNNILNYWSYSALTFRGKGPNRSEPSLSQNPIVTLVYAAASYKSCCLAPRGTRPRQ
jgi:hypothetical protein